MGDSYKTTLNKPYHPIRLSHHETQPPSDGSSQPAFITPDLQTLDKFYRPIQRPIVTEEDSNQFIVNIFTKEKMPKYHQPGSTVDLNFPNPTAFQDYGLYLKALDDYKRRSQNWVSSTALPYPLAGLFWIPGMPKIFSKEEKTSSSRFRTFKATLWPLLPKNYLQMMKMVYEGGQVDPNAKFPDQIPKREEIKYSHHLSSACQWMSQMIPSEPRPFLYDKYEDYEKAYKAWASLADQSITQPIPSPAEFATIASIDVVDITASQKEVLVPEKKTAQKPPVDPKYLSLSMHDEVMVKAKLHGIITKTFNPMQPSYDEPEEVYYVQGIDQSVFLNELQQYGNYQPTLNSQTPVRPTFHVQFEKEKTVEPPKPIKFESFCSLLNMSLSAKQIENIVEAQKSELNSIIEDPHNLKTVLMLSNRSLRHSVVVSQFLHSIIRHSASANLVKILQEPSNLSLLNRLVVCLSVTSKDVSSVIPMTTSTAKDMVIFNQCYLFSCICFIFDSMYKSQFLDEAAEVARKLSFQASKVLAQASFRSSLISGLNCDGPKSQLLAALHIIYTRSPHIQRILFGPDFIIWMNEISDSFGGKVLIMSVAHGMATFAASQLLNKSISTTLPSILDTLTPRMTYLVKILLLYLQEDCEQMGIRFTGDHIVNVFEKVALNQQISQSLLLIPLASVLANQKVISNFSSPDFQTLLVSIVCKLCRIMTYVNPTTFRNQISALTLLTRDQQCCFAMSQIPKFMSLLAEQLNQTDMYALRSAWRFFKLMSSYDTALSEILGNDSISRELTKITNTDNNLAIRKLFKFATRVIGSKNIDLKVKLCNLLMKSLGRIVCIYQMRSTTFLFDHKAKVATEQLIQAISSMDSEKTAEFQATFRKHMSTKDPRYDLRDRFSLTNLGKVLLKQF